MKEVWKDIKNYEGLYQVSSKGNIKSFPRRGTRNTLYVLKMHPNKKGYLQVVLNNNKRETKRVHRLVAEAFIPNPNNLPQVNHKDGNKLNNNVDNLEWCTNEYNMAEAIRIGLRDHVYSNMKGEKHFASRKVNQYDLKGNFIKQWVCITDIERTLGFDNRNIIACCRKRRPTAYKYKWEYADEK